MNYKKIEVEAILPRASKLKAAALERNDFKGFRSALDRGPEQLGVIVDLVPDNEHIQVKLIKEHNNPEIAKVQLEVDPRTMLLRWR